MVAMPDLDHWPLARLLSTAARLAEQAWTERLKGLDLTHAGVTALEILAASGPASQAVLAARARVQPQTMGKTLAKLEASGYIGRQRDLGDGRIWQVHISDRGQSALMGARVLQQQAVEANISMPAKTLDPMLAAIIRGLRGTP